MSVRARGRSWLAAFALLACVGAAHADDEAPSVTPYRPTVSNPADLPAPGWLELELGGSRQTDSDSARTDSVPWLLKYAFDEDHGILVGGTAFERVALRGSASSGFGDSVLEWKQRLPLHAGVAFGFEAGLQVPSARDDLGVDGTAWLANGIFSTDLGAAHLDINAGATHFAAAPPHASHWQRNWAAALSHPLGARFGIAAEISGTAQRRVEHSQQALTALNYNVSRRCVLDLGVAYGLDRRQHGRDVFAGATLLLGRLR